MLPHEHLHGSLLSALPTALSKLEHTWMPAQLNEPKRALQLQPHMHNTLSAQTHGQLGLLLVPWNTLTF